jgi:chaperonin cofactor prefoldin
MKKERTMEDSRESLDRQWEEIDARVEKSAKDLSDVEKRLNALKADIKFWEIALKVDLDGEAAD